MVIAATTITLSGDVAVLEGMPGKRAPVAVECQGAGVVEGDEAHRR